MARKLRKRPTKQMIIQTGIALYLRNGFTATKNSDICKALDISNGQLTFHFPTKEHLLLKLLENMTAFQWNSVTAMEAAGLSPLMMYCLEIAAQTALCEENPAARDLYINAYTLPMTLAHEKEWASRKAHRLFHERLPDWTAEDFRAVENTTSGVELGALMQPCSDNFTLDTKLRWTLDGLMKLYEIPEEERKATIDEILQLDYRRIGAQILEGFVTYMNEIHEQALQSVMVQERSNSDV